MQSKLMKLICQKLYEILRLYQILIIGSYKLEKVDVKMKLILTDNLPVYPRPRRLSPVEKDVVDAQIKVWLDEGITRPSCSDFASPIVQ